MWSTSKTMKYGLWSCMMLIFNGNVAMAQTVTGEKANEAFFKVDCNVPGRSLTEVNEAGYTPWAIKNPNTNTLVLDGNISLTLNAKGAEMRGSYYKAGVQSSELAKMISDGVSVGNEGELELIIKGLPKGVHTIQTYHNNFSVDNDVKVPSFEVYVQGKPVHKGQCTRRVLLKENALVLKTEVNVKKEGDEVVMLFKPVAGKDNDVQAVYLNGLEINTPDVLKQAQSPTPLTKDMHADADAGKITLDWKPGKGAVKHHVYIGYDSLKVAEATPDTKELYKGVVTDSCYKLDEVARAKTYFWRVDEEDANGNVTTGNVWSFKARQLAFYGAEGYGRYAIGGRGGKVVYVTNLNDDGPGSLREALTANIGPRTVVFAVSGTIELKSRLGCSYPYVTIAGQTAPGKGICIKGAPMGIASDGICRFIRVRLGKGRTFDGLGMAGANHSIVDHCSVSWTIDEAFSSRNAKNITLQRSLISEALNVAGHKNYAKGKGHGYAATIGGNVGSFHHNLLAHCMGRNWSLGGGLDGNGYYAGKLDIFNNVVFNWGGRATDGGAHEVNFVNNYYKAGPSTTQKFILRAQLEGTGKGSQSYYCQGNILEEVNGDKVTDNEKLRRYELSKKQTLDWNVWVDQPFFPSYAKIDSAEDAYKSVLSDVGCNMPLFDEHDMRIIKEVRTGKCTYTGSIGNLKGIIDDEQDAGGYENYPEETRPADFDTDMDGLPDWWEQMCGTNPNSPKGDFSDANADANGDGYTALEDYLEWMSVPHFYLETGKEKVITLSDFFAGYDKPAYEAACDNMNVEIDGDKLVVPAARSRIRGVVYVDIKATDRAGSFMTRRIGLCVK